MKTITLRRGAIVFVIILILVIGYNTKVVLAQNGIFIPLIGITSVPKPLALPEGPGNVTYKYAVKNFLSEAALTDVKVVDDKCSSVKFVEGDDNNDSKLDYSETWRYSCTTKLIETSQSTATATGTAFGLLAKHQAFATVVVGSDILPPLVSIVNITKVAYPLSLPTSGGDVVFTYRVNNPGDVPLSNISVTDDKCSEMSGKLGDTNGNNLLDMTEVWVYTCKTHLNDTTTSTVGVTSFANGLKAVGYATFTVKVETPPSVASPDLPNTGNSGVSNLSIKYIVWGILAAVLLALIVVFILMQKRRRA